MEQQLAVALSPMTDRDPRGIQKQSSNPLTAILAIMAILAFLKLPIYQLTHLPNFGSGSRDLLLQGLIHLQLVVGLGEHGCMQGLVAIFLQSDFVVARLQLNFYRSSFG